MLRYFNRAGSFRSFSAGLTTLAALSFVWMFFVQQAYSAQATIAWNSDISQLVAYKVYYGIASGNYTDTADAGNDITYTLQNLSASTYYIAVTAYDSSGRQSAYSPELVIYPLTASAKTGGSISPVGSFFQAQGASKTFTITPSAGYQVASVLVDGVSVGAVASYTLSNIADSHTISATFLAKANMDRVILWTNTSGLVSVWGLDPSDNYLRSHLYGPYTGWRAINYSLNFDGTGRLLWVNTSGHVVLWMLDITGNYIDQKEWGPYPGWTPVTYASNPLDGTARLIWAGTGGFVSIWKLDASDNYISSTVFGPFSGWKPIAYAFNTTSGTGQLTWASTGGAASVWKLDASDNYVSSQVYGPFSRWKPIAYSVNSADGTSILTWTSSVGQASIWKFDSSGDYDGCNVYGPFSGWSPLTCAFNSVDGTPRLIWSGTGGMVSIWSLNSSGNYLGSTVFGPFNGWMPIGYW